MSKDPVVWLIAFLTLASFSWLIKQNPVYTFVERLFIGLGAGYSALVGVENVINGGIKPLVGGKYIMIIPLVLAMLLVSSIIGSMRSNRYLPMTFLVGIGTGLAMRTAIQSQFLQQIKATWGPLTGINSWIILVGSISSLMYFVFTFGVSETGSTLSSVRTGIRTVGIWILMATFGSAFATAVNSRLSTLISRFQFLFGEWILIFK